MVTKLEFHHHKTVKGNARWGLLKKSIRTDDRSEQMLLLKQGLG